jgi:hypothetical protein
MRTKLQRIGFPAAFRNAFSLMHTKGMHPTTPDSDDNGDNKDFQKNILVEINNILFLFTV